MTAATSVSGRRAALLLVDGARNDVFESLAEAGELPHIERHLLGPGGVTPATTVFPSTTGVAYLPFLTGCYPGTCDIPGIRWLDAARYGGDWWRNRDHVRNYCGYQGEKLNTDLPDGMRTVFDLVPDSLALCSPITRGLRDGRERVSFGRKFWGSLAHYTAGYGPLDRAVGQALCRLAPQRPRFVFAVFPGVDGVTHLHDPWHPAVWEMYRQIDGIVGAYADAGGFDGDHLTLLVSDHGLERVRRHTDISLALEAIGLPTLRHPILWRKDPEVAVMVSGNASAQVYFKPRVLRERRFSVAEVEAGALAGVPPTVIDYLAGLPGVAMVVGTDDSGLTLISRLGRATLSETDCGRIAYRPDTADVLSLGAAGEYSDREWLERTLETPYPDAPVQLLQLFRSSRTGDLVVIADVGSDLRVEWEFPEHRSGHGSLIAAHMRCLVVSNAPLAGPVRTVDLFPLVLDYLGVPVPDGIDGVIPGKVST